MLLGSGPHNQCRGTKPQEPGTGKRHLPHFLQPPQEAGTIRPISWRWNLRLGEERGKRMVQDTKAKALEFWSRSGDFRAMNMEGGRDRTELCLRPGDGCGQNPQRLRGALEVTESSESSVSSWEHLVLSHLFSLQP